MMASVLRRAVAETIGSFALVSAGCGAIAVQAQTGALGHLGVALAFGLVVMVMIAALGHVSGAHFNPAVTVTFALTRHFPWRLVPLYLAAQLAGAMAGALALRALFGRDGNLGVTTPAGSAIQGLAIEALLTGFLMFVVMAVATDTRAVGELAAIAVGGAVALDALWGGPLTGASMNPARSFGPALVTGLWQDHWIYWIGPLAGAAVGGALYQFVRSGEKPDGAPQRT